MSRPTFRPCASRTKTDGLLRAVYALASVALLALVYVSSGIAPLASHAAGAQTPARTLTLEERVAYQRAVDEVYWRHTIWPGDSGRQKPGLDEVLPAESTRAKVEDMLRKSEALARLWKRPVTAEQLQGEMTRMARETKQPEVLRELWQALGKDPFVVAETLARASLVDRQARSFYAMDERFHGVLRARAEAQLQGRETLDALRRRGGRFSEVEFVKVVGKAPRVFDEKGSASPASTESGALELNAAEWEAERARLAEMFRGASCAECGEAAERLPTGAVSSLQESADSFYVASVVSGTERSLKVARVEWPKIDFDSWWPGESANYAPTAAAAGNSGYQLAEINAATADDTWTPVRSLPVSTGTAVWTGTEMIVWGGLTASGGRTNAGSRYRPATDSWTSTSTVGAPSERAGHTAVWTGTEMIIWGGCGASTDFCGLASGGRYDPATNTWKPTSTGGATPRSAHTAVWTGAKMIVWGGCSHGYNNRCTTLNTGSVYDPAADNWKPMSLVNAPSPRNGHRAVWTGMEMIVWGGSNTGGRYNPDTDTWRPTNTFDAPSARAAFTMVWTGTEVVVWSGYEGNFVTLSTGGRYNPATDTWTQTSTANAPDPRYYHTAVWSGSEMIVYGGRLTPAINQPDQHLNTGGRYNPATDTWRPTSTVNAPTKLNHVAVWAGTEMIVWGGSSGSGSLLKSGARYDPANDTWTPTNNEDSPPPAELGVWAGAEMIVWGREPGCISGCRSIGGRYHPATDRWRPMSLAGAPAGDYANGAAAVWTGREMILWGAGTAAGARYDPLNDAWSRASTTGAPAGKSSSTAVWSGSEMLVWGGDSNPENVPSAGGRYNPSTDTWQLMSMVDAPAARSMHSAVWTGTEMIVWGGSQYFAGSQINTGGRYNPSTDTWRTTATTGAPEARLYNSTVWTGTEMIVWGGWYYSNDGSRYLNTGGRYDPVSDSWVPTSLDGVPQSRSHHRAVWTGSAMIVWGGLVPVTWTSTGDLTYTGARYNPATDLWTPTSLQGAPSRRSSHVQVWTGTQMIVWGGRNGPNDSAIYHAPGAADGNSPPSVRLTSPTGGDTFQSGDTIRLSAEAADSDGTVAVVRFYANGTPVGSAQSPFNFDWREVRGGDYTLTAVAVDDAGTEANSAAVAITVTPDTTPPVCALGNPPDGATYAYGNSIRMDATAAANRDRAISQVEFLDNGRVLTTYTTPTYNAPWSYVYSAPAPGAHNLSARCTDNTGAATTSPVRVVTVESPGYTISGQILEERGFPLAGIRVRLDGAAGTSPLYQTTTVQGNGNYSFSGLQPGASYTVTPESGSWSFSPASNTYASLSGNMSSQHFTGRPVGYGISGHLRDASGKPIYPATLNLSGSKVATTGTDINGYYFFSNLAPGGTYTIQPYKNAYRFAPNFLTFDNLNAEQTADFTGRYVPASINFTASVEATGEGGEAATLTVSRTVNAEATVTVNYSTADGTATAGADYAATSGTLSFAAGELSKTVSVPILDDAVVEGAETFIVTLSDPAAAVVSTPSVTSVTINENDTCSYQLSQTARHSPVSGESVTVNVTAPAGCAWTAASNSSFISLGSGAAGSGSGVVAFSVAANTASAQRTGTLTIAGHDFTVTQAGVACTFGLAAANQSVGSAGGSAVVNVTAAAGDCSWAATSDATWITINSGASGSGNGEVNYSVAANTSSQPRTGTLTIAGHNFTLTQAGTTCSFNISPVSRSFVAAGGAGSVNLTAAATDCAWAATSDANWIAIGSRDGGIGSGVIDFSVAANPGSLPRTATLTIAGLTLTVTQAGVACSYTVSEQTPPEFTAAGGQGVFRLVAPQGCAWAVSSLTPWITITSAPGGTGTGSITFAVAANTGAARTGQILHTDDSFLNVRQAAAPASLRLESSAISVSEGAQRAEVKVMREGDTSGAVSVTLQTVDDTESVSCASQNGKAYARCDYATTIETLTWAAGDAEPKTVSIPLIDDGRPEGAETLRIMLSDPQRSGIGDFATATLTITDNEAVEGANPIFTTSFFVRQQYLDFLSREPEAGEPWSGVLDRCPDLNGDPACDRITVSQSFFGSPEFRLKGFFVYNFYSVAFNRRPTYEEIIPDMRKVSGATAQEVYQKRAAFPVGFTSRAEFKGIYDAVDDAAFVNTLLDRYGLQQITTPDPANPEGGAKVTLARAHLINRLNPASAQPLTRAQVLRAMVESDEVGTAEYNRAFVAMQYYGYLRRTPEEEGYQAWLKVINQDPNNIRVMVNGFMNSTEYRLRFGQP